MVVQKVTLCWKCGETGVCILVGAPDFCRRVIKSFPSLSAWARDDTVRNGSPFNVAEPSSIGTVEEIQKNVRGCAHGSD